MRRREKLPAPSSSSSPGLPRLRTLVHRVLLALLVLQLTSSISGGTVTAATMRRLPAFVQVSSTRRPFLSRASPILSISQSLFHYHHRAFCLAAHPKATTTTTTTTTSTGPSPDPAARTTLKESLQDLQEIANFFPGHIKDNSTAFFHAPQAYVTVPEALTATLHIPPDRAVKLHEIGAVYIYRQDKFRRTRLIADYPPASVLEGDLFRVYLFPRRFPECVTDYTSRVVWEDEDVMIVDKPPGCPCSLHVSNALEALDVAASASLGIPLIRMNRLDIVTTGLVPLAKTAQGATRFWEEIRRDRVGKRYKALLMGPVPVGVLEHYMPGKIIHRRPAPRAISRLPLEGWKLCQTRILSCTPVPLSDLDTVALLDSNHIEEEVEEEEEEENKEDGAKEVNAMAVPETDATKKSSLAAGLPSPSSLPSSSSSSPSSFSSLPPTLYEVEAELITGRTHQLRAVFAAEGSPIWQDTMYAPMVSFLLDDEEAPEIQSLYPLCVEPRARTGIALQCAGLTFWGKTVTAGRPWWRQREGMERKAKKGEEEEEGMKDRQVQLPPAL